MDFEFAHLFGGAPLFVERRAFRAWAAASKMKAQALSSAHAVQDAIEIFAQRDVRPQVLGDVAVIDVSGPITYKSSWLSMFFGLASIEDLQTQFRMAQADATVNTILFRVDSPGGVVDMMPEFADEIFQGKGRGTKAVIAVADTVIASCAYWLASQVDTIYVTASSQVGAIGVFVEHEEISGMLEKAGITVTLIAHGDHKVDGNPYEPLSDSARADLQASVDEVGDWFDSAVARGRRVSKATVLAKFGQGKVFRGKQAVDLGLADKIGTFGQVLAGLTSPRRTTGVRATAQLPAMRAGVVPHDASEKLAPRDTPWSALTLSDFTDKSWDKLTEAEKKHIAGHFAWAASMPPETFGDLKLGHHRPSDGAVVFRGVTAALGRLDQTQLPSADKGKVRSHLEHHQAQFEKDKPKSDAAVVTPRLRGEADADGNGDEPVEPDDDGNCPEGYVLDGDLCYLIEPKDADDASAARADHTDVGRNSEGKFHPQCSCSADCACMKGGSDLCSTKCMTCNPSCACLTRALRGLSQAERDAVAIAAVAAAESETL